MLGFLIYVTEISDCIELGSTYSFGDGVVANLTSQNDNTTTHSYPVGVSATYNVVLYVNSSLGTNNSLTQQIILDFVSPTLSVSYPSSNNITTKDGYVELHFNYTDNNGIKRVWIYWDDGTVENATGDTFVNHYYLENGNYDVVIEVEDLAGNIVNQTIVVIVSFPSETTTQSTPLPAFWTLLGLLSVATYVLIIKKRE